MGAEGPGSPTGTSIISWGPERNGRSHERPGEIVRLLGPNGAGKTTLVSIVAGLRSADAGEVRVDGIDALARDATRASPGVVATSAMRPGVSPSTEMTDDPARTVCPALGPAGAECGSSFVITALPWRKGR